MKFLQLLKNLLFKQGLDEKTDISKLTQEQIEALSISAKEETGMDLPELLSKVSAEIKSATDADAQAKAHQETLDTLAGILGNIIPNANTENNNQPTNAPASSESIIAAAKQFAETLKDVMNQAAPQAPISTSAPILGLNGPGTTSTHFLGIAHNMYARTNRWNEIAALGRHSDSMSDPTKADTEAFNNAFSEFGSSLASRYEQLRQENKLNVNLASSFDNDYSGLDSANLGKQFLIRRQDALIAYLIKRYNVYNIFPRRYGVQDRDILFSAFFSQVSQAYQEGEVFKGSMQLQPEMAHVDDAMIKVQFKPMKELERMYLGYLNEEGSDPMKWSMIEWQLKNIMETAISEQNHRRIMGIAVAPEKGVPGHYLHSSTGVIYTLFRYYAENKLKLHDDPSFCGYTKGTMLSTVKDMIEQIILDSSADNTVDITENFRVVLNVNHRAWWRAECRDEYGKDMDFDGTTGMMNRVPDLEVKIVWLPNLGQLPFILIDEPRNIQLVEYKSGEMLAMQFDRAMEVYKGWSVWKEGCGASFVGKHFNTKAALDANNYQLQRIFMNAPLSFIGADATEIDASKGFWFRSAENTAATKLTDIKNAKHGVGYIIEAGDEDNPTAIDKTGVFSDISNDYAPSLKGDYIFLVLNAKGDKFLELERREAGVRTINKYLQPNIPGAR